MSASEPKVFLNGKPVEHPHEDHHHVSPVWEFTAVFIALVCLTILTYAVSFAGLGSASLPVAMVVAFIKASLVVGYFMHLKYEDRFYAFIFLVTLIRLDLLHLHALRHEHDRRPQRRGRHRVQASCRGLGGEGRPRALEFPVGAGAGTGGRRPSLRPRLRKREQSPAFGRALSFVAS